MLRDLDLTPGPTADSPPRTPAQFSPTPSDPPDTQGALRPTLLTKADLEALSDCLSQVIRSELSQVKADIANMDARLTVTEADTRALREDTDAAVSTITGCEASLTHITTRVDDLDNRSRRMNLRVRGVREMGPNENIPEILRTIFSLALGGQQPRIGLVRAHRALRTPPAPGEQPRDIICCLDNSTLNARRMGRIRLEDQEVTIFQDLSRYTLQARKNLRPVTAALQAAGIQYRWGYPFSLSARRGQELHTIKAPADVQGFQQALGLPPTRVQNWLTHHFIQQAAGLPPPPPARLASSDQRRPSGRPGPARPEE
ncbi:Hypothetical predicted protein [Pelobates cultripes]|uniref:L1 transposable element RRM domain-containing protein n=1 Tax=Pelobates cultripes TaxID=61616 RepID=A0AAD1VTU9_PELCU|nr:Hypothetical predicted protein [Pelobates cultripes]CAH2250759.1 Hypothetical predicted protein [Pelobates cultripes]